MFRYENVGASIKGLARAIAIIAFIPYGIIAIVLVVATEGWGIFLSPIVIGIGYGIAWLSGLLLFGFGELISSSAEQATLLRRLSGKTQAENDILMRATKVLANTANEKKVQSAQTTQPAQPANAYTDGSWVCTCGQHNPKYVTTCTCGKNKSELEI